MQKSARGALEFIFYWRNFSNNSHTVFSMRGVQGGRSGSAEGVYTHFALD